MRCVVDLHSDVMIEVARRRGEGERAVLARDFVPRLRADDVDTQLLMVGGDFPLFPHDAPAEAFRDNLTLMEAFFDEADEAPGALRVVQGRADLDAPISSGILRCVLHWEGGGAIASVVDLRVAWRLGVRSIGLTWNGPNALADGCAVPNAGGLTALGRQVVAEANRLGILLDVSHLADAGVAEVCELSTAPIVASHSNARGAHDHIRNLSDEHIAGIVATGGLVGACAYPPMLRSGGPAVLGDVVRHVEYLCEVAGVDHVGIGPDFIGYLHDSWFDLPGVREFKEELTLPFPEGFDSSAGFSLLMEALADRGISPSQVEQIMGSNARRVLREVLA